MLRSICVVLGTGFLAARAADHFWPPTVVEEVGQPPMIKTYSTVAGIGTAAFVAGLLSLRSCKR